MRTWWLWVAVLGWTMSASEARAGDRLDAARKEASSGGGGGFFELFAAFSDDDDDDDVGDDDYDDDDDAPTRTPPPGPVSLAGFLPHPYAGGRPGFVVHSEPGEDLPDDARLHALRLSAEGAYLYEDVWRASTQLTVMLPFFYTRFGYDLMLEGPTPKLDGDVEVEGSVRDRLHFATVELGPQFVPEEMFAARLGLVGTLMFDDPRSLPVEPTAFPGLGAALEFEFFPVRPLVFTARGAASRLGGTHLLQARFTAGVALDRFEIYAGYDHRVIGKVRLGGPTLGVAARF